VAEYADEHERTMAFAEIALGQIKALRQKRSTGEHLGRVTVSIGVATLHKADTLQSLIERTDGCLYAAKRHGRNRVMCETDPEVTAGGTAMQVA
jgi:diguanylate cyclase